MLNKETIKKYYLLGAWNEAMVINAKVKGVITQEAEDDILQSYPKPTTDEVETINREIANQ